MSKQLSVKEMLQKKKKQDKTEDTIHLPSFFAEYTDSQPVLPSKDNPYGDNMYHCSTMARNFILQHSNLDEIVQYHFEKQTNRTIPKSAFVGTAIRSAMSCPTRKLMTAYKNFKFDSLRNESIARILLQNPLIDSENELGKFKEFYNEHQLKICHIPLGINNDVHKDALTFIEYKRKRQQVEGIPYFLISQLEWEIKRKEYLRQNVVQLVKISHLSVRLIEKISNFKTVCKREMRLNKIDESKYDEYAYCLLETFKHVQGTFLIQPFFIMDPLYTLITNIMTEDQQNNVAESYNLFCRQTNAPKLLSRLADGPPRRVFHQIYKNRDNFDRKLPPFHTLVYFDFMDVVPGVVPTQAINVNEAPVVQKTPILEVQEMAIPQIQETPILQIQEMPIPQTQETPIPEVQEVISKELLSDDDTSSNSSVVTIIQSTVEKKALLIQETLIPHVQKVVSKKQPGNSDASSDSSVVMSSKAQAINEAPENMNYGPNQEQFVSKAQNIDELQTIFSTCPSEMLENAQKCSEKNQKMNKGRFRNNSNSLIK